ncbi:MAG TPA: PEP/pyruvate-binding domain-containing protein, partial [Spirochaetota bacterium]|nr:PEP/pyruvate-binding domain-containing protein [Spirochaetota bacterium]
IGGKAVGMLIARAVLKKNSKKWSCFLEEHDSFYIGSDVFYNFLIINGCWWIKRQLKDISQAYDRSYEIKERILSGKFPAHIENQFTAMLDYYGQSPIIVRSSSLLEDAYGNAFSGKYESVFCANQGTPEERLEDFIVAVLTVYASTMSKNALAYRSHWNLLEQEEQMAILVQRVSGEQYDDLFLPHLAGTGYSYNPFVWDKDIDPDAGFLRLVCGLGTRAVDYCDDDYTRIVSLSAPAKRPESNVNDLNKYSQHKIDLIDLEQNNKTVKYFTDLPFGGDNFPLELLSSYDKELKKIIKKYNKKNMPRVLTFDKLLKETGFVKCMHEIVQTLARAYQTHVDIEFTANFDKDNNFYINLLQCRPFQVKSAFDNITIPETIPDKDIVLKTTGPLIGHSRLLTLDSIIYVNPDVYSRLNMQDRYQVARVVGKAAHFAAQQGKQNIMLIGPGRWGTSSPELGVPVNFTEIKTVSVVCEFVYMRDDVTPDVSLGTHFFNDLVEMNILYLVIYPDSSSHFLNKSFLLNSKNRLADLVPDSIRYADSVRVIDLTKEDKKLSIYAQSKKQKAVCFYSTTETKEKL